MKTRARTKVKPSEIRRGVQCIRFMFVIKVSTLKETLNLLNRAFAQENCENQSIGPMWFISKYPRCANIYICIYLYYLFNRTADIWLVLSTLGAEFFPRPTFFRPLFRTSANNLIHLQFKWQLNRVLLLSSECLYVKCPHRVVGWLVALCSFCAARFVRSYYLLSHFKKCICGMKCWRQQRF